jgi:tetratricopeptide (TPR) repeat protein
VLAICQQALSNHDDNDPLIANLCLQGAQSAIKLGMYCDAIDFCNRSLAIVPDSVLALTYRAEALVRVYDFDAALSDYHRLCQLTQDDASWKAHVQRAKDNIKRLGDHYHVLELDPASSCSAADIRRAYLQKCLRWHPDKNQGTSKRAR